MSDIPYFREYTAPDGTKRRPLVERCEECRPRHPTEDHVYLSDARDHGRDDLWWRHDDRVRDCAGINPVRDDYALALCFRTAFIAARGMLKHNEELVTNEDGELSVVEWPEYFDSRTFLASFSGSDDEPLVALCHYLLDRKGVEP